MNTLAYKCLENFHLKYRDSADQKITGISAFRNLLQKDYSAENLLSKIIVTEQYWNEMLKDKGLGLAKMEKLKRYRSLLLDNWQAIKQACDSENEEEIAKIMGLHLWDLQEGDFIHSYLGVIQHAVEHNKLWKNPLMSKIFCSYFGFTTQPSKSIEQIADENDVKRERIRQLKIECIENFENDFWFMKDALLAEKLAKLFDIDKRLPAEFQEQAQRVNVSEKAGFSTEFYQMVLSFSFDLVVVGSIHDVKNLNSLSKTRNIFKHLYLLTRQEYQRCRLDKLIDFIAVELATNSNHFEQDHIIDLSAYATIPLLEQELEFYNQAISLELDHDIELEADKAVIKRNSLVTQPELVEQALIQLGGFAYMDDIYKILLKTSPEKMWTMDNLRSSFRGDNFYSVGKNSLFGLKNLKDLRAEMGNGTLNEVIRIYLSNKNEPVQIFELYEHVNTLYPRPKNLHTSYTILIQDSKKYFRKFGGGFYGLRDREYQEHDYQRIAAAHSIFLTRTIKNSNGISFEDLYRKFSEQYALLEVQVRYLLHQIESNSVISFIGSKYFINAKEDAIAAAYLQNEDYDEDEFGIVIDEDELEYDEANQPDVPGELADNAMAQIQIRRGQPKFRLKLLSLYKRTCIVTGCKISELLEAAHILPHSIMEDYSISNGLLLRADIHTLFDLNLMAINPEDLTLKLNPQLQDSDDYKKFHNLDIGQRIQLLHGAYKLNEKALLYRWECFTSELPEESFD